jgi:hypothetical protein
MCTRFREYFPCGHLRSEYLALCHRADRQPVRREVGYDYVGLCDRCRRLEQRLAVLELELDLDWGRVYRPGRYRYQYWHEYYGEEVRVRVERRRWAWRREY